ncbi:MAG: 50S ribosomal protein L18 [Candidatus Bathyarchaeota archaeon]
MGTGPRYHVAFRRRRTNQTDYHMRKAMIRSKMPRLVVRPSLKHIYIQLVEVSPSGDKILTAVCSKELEKFGWKASCKNISAAYLSGLLLGKKALAIKVEDAILDIGLRRPSTGSKVFAVLKGVIDTGLKISHGEQVLPNAERIRGEHILLYAKKLLEEDKRGYEKQFSKGLKPEQLVDNFNHVKDNILASLKVG